LDKLESNSSSLFNAHLLSTRIIPHPGVGRAVEGTSVPSRDPNGIKGRPFEDDTTRERRRSRHFEDSVVVEDLERSNGVCLRD